MKWILILFVIGYGDMSTTLIPHKFNSELECKTFVAQLRNEHHSKRIDASCIAVAEQPSALSANQQ